jgi:Rrf2 family protein
MALEIIRRKTDYGLRGLVHLALAAPGEPVLARSVAAQEQIPEPFLHKILRELADCGMVRAHRGRDGGFSLAAAPREITVRAVMEALQGPVAVNRCLIGEDSCLHKQDCGLKDAWIEVQDRMLGFLDSVTVEDLAHSLGRNGRPAPKGERERSAAGGGRTTR